MKIRLPKGRGVEDVGVVEVLFCHSMVHLGNSRVKKSMK